MTTITDLVQTLVTVRLQKSLKDRDVKIDENFCLSEDDSLMIRDEVFDALNKTFSRSKFSLSENSLRWVAEQLSSGLMINGKEISLNLKEPTRINTLSTKDIEAMRSIFKDSSMFDQLNNEFRVRKMD